MSRIGAPVCAVCSLIITSEAFQLGDVYYHVHCLVCSQCGQHIPSGQFFSTAAGISCIECGAKQCQSCRGLILSEGLELDGVGCWHSECFVCAICCEPIVDSYQTLLNGQPVCVKCPLPITVSSQPSGSSVEKKNREASTASFPPPSFGAPPPPPTASTASAPASASSGSTLKLSMNRRASIPSSSASPSPAKSSAASTATPLSPNGAPRKESALPLASSASGATSPRMDSSSPLSSSDTLLTISSTDRRSQRNALRLSGGFNPEDGDFASVSILSRTSAAPTYSSSLTSPPSSPKPPTNSSPRQPSESPVTWKPPSSIASSVTTGGGEWNAIPDSRRTVSTAPSPRSVAALTSSPAPSPPTHRRTDSPEALRKEEEEAESDDEKEEKEEKETLKSIRQSISAAQVGKPLTGPQVIAAYKRASAAAPATPVKDRLSVLPGEDILERFEGVAYIYTAAQAIVGTLLDGAGVTQKGWKVYLGNIHRVLRLGDIGFRYYAFEIICKEFRNIRIALDGDEENKLWNFFNRRVSPTAFAVRHKLAIPDPPNGLGWDIYDPTEDWKRVGLPNKHFRITRVNADQLLSPSYPPILIVPAEISDDEVRKIAAFRSKARIPVVTWRHSNDAVLVRCAQPRTGLMGRTCEEDEKFFALMLKASQNSRKPLQILDARPRMNAVANQLMGAGSEKMAAYENTKRKFLGIANIHVMRQSLNKMRKFFLAEERTIAQIEAKIRSLDWYDHLSVILASACQVVHYLNVEACSVIVHCSDGWDRTPQLVALAELILDPYYRTIKGFAVLLEKEWLSFGHMFQLRIGHGQINVKNKELSPLLVQVPYAFEFNDKYLVFIARHAFSLRFGTFLCNTDVDRAHLRTTTLSVWSMLTPQKIAKYTNPAYAEGTVTLPGVRTAKSDMKLWKSFWCKYIRP